MSDISRSERRKGVGCYAGLWVTGLIFYLVEEKSEFVRFHAKQSLAAFIPLTILLSLFPSILPFQLLNLLNSILSLVTIILWIICMYKAGKGEKWKVPLVGELIEKGTIRKEPGMLAREERLAGVYCYAGLFVTGLIFYAVENEREFVRFHAKQSILAFLPLSILTWAVFYIPEVGEYLRFIIGLLILVLWIVCMVKAYQGIKWEIPLIWPLANRFAILFGEKKEAEKPKSKEEFYPFAIFQFVTKASEAVGNKSLIIFKSAVKGYNRRFNRDIKVVERQISLSNVEADEWPELIKFVLRIYSQCIGPVTWQIAKEIEELREIAEQIKKTGLRKG
jgi:uncharacterized membrane protein